MNSTVDGPFGAGVAVTTTWTGFSTIFSTGFSTTCVTTRSTGFSTTCVTTFSITCGVEGGDAWQAARTGAAPTEPAMSASDRKSVRRVVSLRTMSFLRRSRPRQRSAAPSRWPSGARQHTWMPVPRQQAAGRPHASVARRGSGPGWPDRPAGPGALENRLGHRDAAQPVLAARGEALARLDRARERLDLAHVGVAQRDAHDRRLGAAHDPELAARGHAERLLAVEPLLGAVDGDAVQAVRQAAAAD